MAEKSREKLRVPPEAMSIITLDEIAGRLADLTELGQKVLKHMEETTPEGIDVLVFEGTVSPPVKHFDLVADYPFHRLFRVEIINKGPSTTYARVNHSTKEMSVEAEETIPFEKPKSPHIEYITLRLEAATTVKILGRY